MTALFVDTFYWIAITDPNDSAHQDVGDDSTARRCIARDHR
jgi:hypothetical protein